MKFNLELELQLIEIENHAAVRPSASACVGEAESVSEQIKTQARDPDQLMKL